MHRSRAARLVLLLSLLTIAMGVRAGEDVTPGCRLPPHTPTNPRPQLIGAWQTVVPEEGGGAIHNILGMQTVHNVILPSGKVLMLSGSSWRNLGPIETYPEFPNPATPRGIWNRDQDPFRNENLATYYPLVNNAAVYDPVANTFYRIPSPAPVPDPNQPDHFAPNDFFCTGHQHLPDGNVLFAGGTQYYYPYRTGNNSTFIFDWKKEEEIDWRKVDWRQLPQAPNDPWVFSGFMKRGRWYPSLLPLLDGRLVLFSGFVGFDPGFPEMYQFEMNHYVEFFDPGAFSAKNPQAAWRAVDVKATPNSPFTILINPDFQPTPGTTSCKERCITDNKYDAFKLYPENYLMPDGRIFLTREGDWVSLRTCDTAFMRRTKNTYWATVGGTRDKPSMSFSRGPDRPEDVSSYGTSIMDPNTNRISIFGGQPTSPGTLFPINSKTTTHFAGGRGSRKLETFTPSPTAPGGGTWKLDPSFLGDEPQDDRTMHYAVMLPTKQVLIVNGGNFDFYGPVFSPLMLTPQYDKNKYFTGYKSERMAEAVEPRLYHNSAMLLPDGRVLVSGGNTARATVRSAPVPPADPNRTGQPLPDLSLVDLDVYFFNDGPIATGQKGMLTTPTENWVAELYYPPYLYIDADPKTGYDRRASIRKLTPQPGLGYTFESRIGGQTFYLLRSGVQVRMTLEGLPETACTTEASLVMIKLPSATHGWENGQQLVQLSHRRVPNLSAIDFQVPNASTVVAPPGYYMLFYVDCRGKPTVAQMVRYDDTATQP
jgi:Domain of unknown function (DUF1929)